MPTVPEADELSPYEIFHEDPLMFLNVLDLLESKTLWPVVLIDLASPLDQIYMCCVSWLGKHCELPDLPKDLRIRCQSPD